jgi:hypothetical protein
VSSYKGTMRVSLLVLTLLALAQDGSPPSIVQGMARLQAGDPAGAVTIFTQVTTREPDNSLGWRALGLALQRTKALESALSAFERALTLDATAAAPIYNVAVTHALLGHRDAAFSWLEKARATHRVDMTQVEVDPNLASLKGDPRLAALAPRAEDFREPFVESVSILREWSGEHANDQFGWIARAIGDVDADGVVDIVTSAPTYGGGAGRVYVYSTKSGRLLWTADGGPQDQLGLGVEGAGDTNQDGVPDVIAAAPNGGYARVYSGRDGRVLSTVAAPEGKTERFGAHVAGVGDLDGDGYADVMIGAPDAQEKAGRAYVYSGKDGRTLLTLSGEHSGDNFGSTVAGMTVDGHPLLVVGAPKAGPRGTGRAYVYKAVSTSAAFSIDSDDSGSALGAMFVGVIGDLTGDRVPDIYASDWSNNANGWSSGRVYIHSGADGSRVRTLSGATPNEGFGIGPGRTGDVDGDGYADVVVGSWQYAEAATSGGRVALFSGKTGALLRAYTCRIPGDTFGFDAVGLGDIDGDGIHDLLVSSAWSGIHGFHSGRLFVISSGVPHPKH